MGYFHAMSSQTEGITATAPVRWRSFDTMMGVFWEAEGSSGATGYYRSSDPRIVLFFNDVSDHILLTENGQRIDISSRPMLRAIYVPAGIPIWTRFSADHQFTHLDVHLSKSWLVEKLAPVLGHAGALSALARPAETQNVGEIGAIGNALKQEILASKHHPLYAESLAVAIVVGLIDLILPHCSGPPLCLGKRRNEMANKRPKPEEIVTKLRQVEVLTVQGMPRLDAIRQIGVTEQTYYRWKKKYGGMGTDQLKELKRLQKENERLRKAVSDLTLDKLILAEAAKGNF